MRWIGPALLAIVALLGPALTGSVDPPSVAASAAQLLPPGARVQEVALEGGGYARAQEIRVETDGLRLRHADGWRTISVVRAAGPARSSRMWLGTDQQARDLLARVVHGARTSLLVALLATGVALTLGVLLGIAAALMPRALRTTVEILTDAMLGLPRLLLLLILGVLLRGSPAGLGLAIGLASWMEVCRLVQAESLRLLARPFVAAARVAGAGGVRLALRHLLPNQTPVLIVAAPLVAIQAILLEATLSFLGVSSGVAWPSWGRMVADGQRLLPASWWVMLFPGLLLCVTALAVHALTRGETPERPL